MGGIAFVGSAGTERVPSAVNEVKLFLCAALLVLCEEEEVFHSTHSVRLFVFSSKNVKA